MRLSVIQARNPCLYHPLLISQVTSRRKAVIERTANIFTEDGSLYNAEGGAFVAVFGCDSGSGAGSESGLQCIKYSYIAIMSNILTFTQVLL
jgi:hypothetical protein